MSLNRAAETIKLLDAIVAEMCPDPSLRPMVRHFAGEMVGETSTALTIRGIVRGVLDKPSVKAAADARGGSAQGLPAGLRVRSVSVFG